MEDSKKFYLGLDIGTNSVGIAATDEKYNLLRAKGKDLWAVRLFDEAQTAADRRMKRCARRRLARRRQRVALLGELFADEISKVDAAFFTRLRQSQYWNDDRDESIRGSKYTIFNDLDFTEKDYYGKYPTMYHLRKALIEGGQKFDIRLYYLAIHHIIKYRGHFLSSMSPAGNDNSGVYESIYENLRRIDGFFKADSDDEFFKKEVIESAEKLDTLCIRILRDKKSLTDKKKALKENLVEGRNNKAEKICELLCGGTADLKALDEKFDDFANELKISLRNDNEEKFLQVRSALDDYAEVLDCAKNVFDNIYLLNLIGNNQSLSYAMVSLYEKHKTDLAELKKLVREIARSDGKNSELYAEIFHNVDEKSAGNYANYIGKTKTRNQKLKAGKDGKRKCSNEDFVNFLVRMLSPFAGTSAEVKDFVERLGNEKETGTYMPKVVNADGGRFPHQLHEKELDLILKNLEKDYPSFAEPGRVRGENENDKELSPSDRIRMLLTFRIPYYVGPLGQRMLEDEKGHEVLRKFSWAVFNDSGNRSRITPWNFENRVDKDKSGEGFIRRMTNNCQYLFEEPTLPKCSMLFQKYLVLNFINKIKVNDKDITTEDKKKLFQEVYMTKKKPGINDVRAFFKKQYGVSGSNIRPEKAADYVVSMSSYYLFSKEFFKGSFETSVNDSKFRMAEKIIDIMTVFTDKEDAIRVIRKQFADKITDDQLKLLKGWTFKDYGALSRKLLADLEIGRDDVKDRGLSFLDVLWNTNLNFMEILYHGDYNARQAIDEENARHFAGDTDKDSIIEKMNLSPSVRRAVIQTLKMVDEYIVAVGRKPDRIVVEVTRKEEEKKRTKSRRNQIEEMYEFRNEKDSRVKTLDEIKQLKKALKEKSDDELKSERLFLYFKQLGKCAYTGEKIDILDLSTDTYDVDHIIPQSLVKDDSLENKVLVFRKANQKKTDMYPFFQRDDVVTVEGRKHLERLVKLNLMSNEKYERIKRTEPLNADELRGFIARQLTQTSQAVKAVCDILKQCYYNEKNENGNQKQSFVVYSKAALVSQFREDVGIYKVREVNNLHHAQDAYLNVVVWGITRHLLARIESRRGNIGFAGSEYVVEDDDGKERRINFEKIFKRESTLWNFTEDGERVVRIATKPSAQVTRYAYKGKGGFYNETVYRHSDGSITYPRKSVGVLSDFKKYGGFKSADTSYFCFFTAKDKKGVLVKYIESIPVIVDVLSKNDESVIEKYITDGICKDKGWTDVKIIKPCLKKNSLLDVNGNLMYLTGANSSEILFRTANELFLKNNEIHFVKMLGKFVDKIKKRSELYKNDNDRLEELNRQIGSDSYCLFSNRLGDKYEIHNDELIGFYVILRDKCKTRRYGYKNPLKEQDLFSAGDNDRADDDKDDGKGVNGLKNFFACLDENSQRFDDLNLYDKARLLINAVSYLSGSAPLADLTLIGGAKMVGQLKTSKNISDVKNLKLVEKSVTGLYEKVFDIGEWGSELL